jgi:hypothetical protein
LTRRTTCGRFAAAGWRVPVFATAMAVALSGTLVGCMGTDPAEPRPEISPAGTKGADFGATLLGTRKQLDFTLANSSAGFVKVTALESIAVSVAGNGLSASHSCPTTLNEGESCFISVVYTPTIAAASLAGELRVTSNAGATVRSLAGSAVTALSPAAGAVAFDGSPANSFGDVTVGSFVDRTFTVHNIGNADDTVTVVAPSQTGWSSSHTCTAALVPNATCTVTIRFAPTAVGTSTPTALTVTDAYNTGYGGLTLQPVGVGK